MNLLAHLIAADIRHFRLTIAMWVAVVVAGSVFEALKPLAAGDPGSFQPLALAASLVWLARVLLFAALVPLVVQAHPLVGSDAFWMTRPVPPRALLLSKLILLSSLLLVVPLVCDVVVMAAYRIPPVDIALVGQQSTLIRSTLLILFMAAAAITLNLSRFAMLCGAVLLSLAVLLVVASMIAFSRMDDSPGTVNFAFVDGSSAPVSRGPDQTPALAGSLLFLAAGLAGLVIQYRTRSVKQSVAVGMAGTIVAWLVASAWPWPLIQHRLLVPDWASSASALRLEADPQNVVVDPNVNVWPIRPNPWRFVRAKVWLSEVAPDWLATARLARASLELDRDLHLSSHGRGYSASLPVDGNDEPPLDRALRNALGVRRILGSTPQLRGETAVVLIIRDDELARYRDLTRQRPALGKYRGGFLLDLTQLGIGAVLPLQRGETFQEGAYRVAISEVREANGRLAVRVTTSQASTMFDRRPRPAYSFYLRNRQLGEAAAGLLSPLDAPVYMPLMGAVGISAGSDSSGFAASKGLILFPKTHGFPGDGPGLDAAWLNGAELVVVRTLAEGSVQRTLEIDGFKLSERTAK